MKNIYSVEDGSFFIIYFFTIYFFSNHLKWTFLIKHTLYLFIYIFLFKFMLKSVQNADRKTAEIFCVKPRERKSIFSSSWTTSNKDVGCNFGYICGTLIHTLLIKSIGTQKCMVLRVTTQKLSILLKYTF